LRLGEPRQRGIVLQCQRRSQDPQITGACWGDGTTARVGWSVGLSTSGNAFFPTHPLKQNGLFDEVDLEAVVPE